MDVIVRTKKFATDSLFFLTSAHANVSGDMLNRCRMNAITGKFLFYQMHVSVLLSEVLVQQSRPLRSCAFFLDVLLTVTVPVHRSSKVFWVSFSEIQTKVGSDGYKTTIV